MFEVLRFSTTFDRLQGVKLQWKNLLAAKDKQILAWNKSVIFKNFEPLN